MSDLTSLLNCHQRQVHLDFHTSPFIGDVGSEFDARAFAQTMKRAHVNSVTIFAKCHHGQCYYPTKTGVQHPALKGRDLLGEQIEALHREGIRCPIYTTIVWEEDVAAKHPEWRQLTKDGHFASWGGGGLGEWKFNNYLCPGYQDYIEAHVREICSSYEVDGFFFDILLFASNACWHEDSIRFREKMGLRGDDPATMERFVGAAQKSFAEKFTKIVQGLKPQASLFYNASCDGNLDPIIGPRARQNAVTHFEIESLPSGAWGYFHFPRAARIQNQDGKFWLGMTGRFQKMWGDFGGIKPQPALEYECFRAQALGGGNSIGDQLPPRGTLDAGAYDLIGAVFAQCAEAEPFYEGSKSFPQVGVFLAGYPGIATQTAGKSEEGAVQMCEEAHYDAAVCDSLSDLGKLDLVVLPDTTAITPAIKKQLAEFYERGGKVILSYRAGFDPDGKWALDFLPLKFAGQVEKFPSYWRTKPEFDAALSRSDRVVYEAGMNVEPGPGLEVLVDRVLPYFKRSDAMFSSHFQTPPVAAKDQFPAVVAGERFIYFADPIFREYRQTGNLAARDGWKKAMARLIGEAPFGAGLPITMLMVPRRRRDDLIITLLHYIPVRKALDIDMIEERSSFAGELLRLPKAAKSARLFQGPELARDASGAFILPAAKGRLLIEVPGYAKA